VVEVDPEGRRSRCWEMCSQKTEQRLPDYSSSCPPRTAAFTDKPCLQESGCQRSRIASESTGSGWTLTLNESEPSK